MSAKTVAELAAPEIPGETIHAWWPVDFIDTDTGDPLPAVVVIRSYVPVPDEDENADDPIWQDEQWLARESRSPGIQLLPEPESDHWQLNPAEARSLASARSAAADRLEQIEGGL